MSNNGWIKVHRKMLSNPVVCKDAAHLAVWMYLLLNACHDSHATLLNGKKITLVPGQLVTGRKKIADELDLSESKVQRVLNDFENEQQIEQQTNSGGRLISITNWEQYQENEQQAEQRVNSKRTTTEQRVNTKQEIKELKNERSINPPISPLNDLTPRVREQMERWLQYKKERKEAYKPVGLQSVVSQVRKKVDEFGEDAVIDVIELSMSNQWRGIIWEKIKPPDRGKIPADDGLDEMERLYYANNLRYTGPDYFAGSDSA